MLEIKTIACPSCGSSDFMMISKTRGICNVCGSTFSVSEKEQSGNSEEKKEKSVCVIYINNEWTDEDFIKEAWKSLASEDAPDDIFNYDFSEVDIEAQAIALDIAQADLTYQASVGYDRQEPYIETEEYEVRVGDRIIKKERPVTKYKTVTDWHPAQGDYHAESKVLFETDKGKDFDEKSFLSSAKTAAKESRIFADDEEDFYRISNAVKEQIIEGHKQNFYSAVFESLPGDYSHKKNLSVQTKKITDKQTTIYVVSELSASINYKGKEYTKRAYPFGEMLVVGDKIPNENGLENHCKEIRASIPNMIWEKTKKNTFLSIILMLLSILVSGFIRSYLLVIPIFLASAGFFAYSLLDDYKTEKLIHQQANDECNNYVENHLARKKEKLEEKLRSLGLEDATEDGIENYGKGE